MKKYDCKDYCLAELLMDPICPLVWPYVLELSKIRKENVMVLLLEFFVYLAVVSVSATLLQQHCGLIFV